MGINGGRSRCGEEETGNYLDYHISLPPSIIKRLEEFMKAEERNRSWTIAKALDAFLKKQGY